MQNASHSVVVVRTGRVNPLWVLVATFACIAILSIGLLNRISHPSTESAATIRLYCAAGLRVPVETIAAQYREEYDTQVEIQYGGSNTLLNQLQINQSSDADLYLAADDFYTEKAREFGMADDLIPVAYTVPVLAVPKGNPGNIHSLSDLLQPGIRIGMADPSQAAVGKAVRERLQNSSHGNAKFWDYVQPLITESGVFKPTVNEVANDLKLAAVDAGFVWDSTLAMPDYQSALEQIPIPELAADPNTLSIALLTKSKSRAASAHFARYLTARDRGLKVFEEFGVQPVEGDVWTDAPELTFFCGAVNRRVVDQIVQNFSRDEGVTVNTIYDGCGILTSRMKTIELQRPENGFPDLYMACDRYYLDMDEVRDWFQEAAYISEADLVLVVPKESHLVSELADLVKPGVRVAIGQPDQCTIGVLSWQALELAGLAEAMREKLADSSEVVAEKSSSAHLIPDVVTGHVDAAIAYVTDTLAVRDKIDVLPINVANGVAVQPLSIARSSDHKYLARRLFRRIAESQAAFESAGFRYRGWTPDQPSPFDLQQKPISDPQTEPQP